jgi:hypothetical protein
MLLFCFDVFRMTKFEAFPDRLTPEQILAQAQDAAKDAAEQLTLRKPNTKVGRIRVHTYKCHETLYNNHSIYLKQCSIFFTT